MAEHKRTGFLKQDTSHFLRFPQVKGKIVESVEVDPHVEAVTILFQDRTALSFILEPLVAVFPELTVPKGRVPHPFRCFCEKGGISARAATAHTRPRSPRQAAARSSGWRNVMKEILDEEKTLPQSQQPD